MTEDVSVSDLSLPDIEFLRAVRDINTNPSEYPETDRGKVAANTASIRKATDLDLRKVTYRIGGDHSRGFEQGELGLIKAYSPSLDEESMQVGPRSAELTEKGLELLSELDEEGTGVDGVGVAEGEVSEALKQIKARLDALEGESIDGESAAAFRSEIRSVKEQVEGVEQQVESMESQLDRDWGAMDEDKAEKMETLLKRTPPIHYIMEVLFGIDVDAVRKEDGIPGGDLSAWRQNVLERLEESTGGENTGGSESGVEGSRSEGANASQSEVAQSSLSSMDDPSGGEPSNNGAASDSVGESADESVSTGDQTGSGETDRGEGTAEGIGDKS